MARQPSDEEIQTRRRANTAVLNVLSLAPRRRVAFTGANYAATRYLRANQSLLSRVRGMFNRDSARRAALQLGAMRDLEQLYAFSNASGAALSKRVAALDAYYKHESMALTSGVY